MDGFEVRMQFIILLQRLSASQQSIQRVVAYAVKHFPTCGEDIWECIMEDCQKGSINSRINLLYLLDTLCERCLLAKSQQRSQSHPHRSSTLSEKPNSTLYVDFVARDLCKIVGYVVPEGRQGLPNLVSTKQILESWRSKRILDPHKVDEALAILDDRTKLPPSTPISAAAPPSQDSAQLDPLLQSVPSQRPQQVAPPGSPPPMSKSDVFKRIEEDRERHKRLRERRWVQPISYSAAPLNPNQIPLASFLPLTDKKDSSNQETGIGYSGYGEEELAVDIEFENEWETTSDWNEDDDEVVAEERELCFPREGEGPMDLS